MWFKEIEFPEHSLLNYYSLVFHITDENISQKVFGEYLSKNNIISDTWRYAYKPLYDYPIFPHADRNCSNAKKLIYSVFTLPSHEGMKEEDVSFIIDTVNNFK